MQVFQFEQTTDGPYGCSITESNSNEKQKSSQGLDNKCSFICSFSFTRDYRTNKLACVAQGISSTRKPIVISKTFFTRNTRMDGFAVYCGYSDPFNAPLELYKN